MASVPSPFLSPAAYLELDSRAEVPSEYYDGEMFPIEATSIRHSDIQYNFSAAMRQRLKDPTPCRAFGPTVRLKLPKDRYAYPDIIVVCGKLQLEDKKYDTVLNPTVVIEVLSPSTGDFDRGGKSEMYRSIPSLKEYIVVAQTRPSIERWTRSGERKWLVEEFAGMDAVLPLEAAGVQIPLSEIYERIEFD